MRGEARFAKETLLIECPKGKAAPTKFWLTLPRNMSFRGLFDLAKLRWRIDAIITTSSRKSASGIMKAAAGRASIITARYQSQPAAS